MIFGLSFKSESRPNTGHSLRQQLSLNALKRIRQAFSQSRMAVRTEVRPWQFLSSRIISVAHCWYYDHLNSLIPAQNDEPCRANSIPHRFGEDSNIGPGKVALLEGIKAHGSLSDAARSMGISYR
jgi:hypothetical protein